MRSPLALIIALLTVPAAASARGLHVSGNRLLGGTNQPVTLHGANRSGTEYACIQADAHNVGYAAWTWDTWGNCLSLISNYSGTPANDYGRWLRARYTGSTRA